MPNQLLAVLAMFGGVGQECFEYYGTFSFVKIYKCNL